MKKFIIACAIILAASAAITVSEDVKRSRKLNEWRENGKIITLYVRCGDSIDEYWAEYAPSFVDRYEWREEIKKINSLPSCRIYAGDTIKIRTEEINK